VGSEVWLAKARLGEVVMFLANQKTLVLACSVIDGDRACNVTS
jgi:hypothetical protein